MRFLLTGSLVFSAAATAAIPKLMPAYFAAVLPRMSLSGPQLDNEQRVQEESDREIASRTRSLLAALMPFSEEQPAIYERIAKANSLRPSGVTIERITYQRGETGEITIAGIAQSREHVNAYREALEGEPLFERVSVPVAALVGASEGNFTVSLYGKF